MYNTATSARISTPVARTLCQPIGDNQASEPLASQVQLDRQFMVLLDAFRNTGGLARAQEVFTLYRSRHGADVATLARWIVRREIISFDWQSKVWIPLFQFERTTMTLQPGLDCILSVLNPIFKPEEIAVWFAQPSRWLLDRTPADMLGADANAVLKVACMDRFISV